MKYITIGLIAAFLVGCGKQGESTKQERHQTEAIAADISLIHLDSARIRTIALASIAQKYPNLDSAKLVFDSIHYSVSADGVEAMDVNYRVPSSTETTDQSTPEVQKISTTTETLLVRMSNLGKVENVSKSSSRSVSAKTNR